MTSRNTVVYRYHSIIETVYHGWAFSNTAHLYPWLRLSVSVSRVFPRVFRLFVHLLVYEHG